jgi:hypothetical protein
LTNITATPGNSSDGSKQTLSPDGTITFYANYSNAPVVSPACTASMSSAVNTNGTITVTYGCSGFPANASLTYSIQNQNVGLLGTYPNYMNANSNGAATGSDSLYPAFSNFWAGPLTPGGPWMPNSGIYTVVFTDPKTSASARLTFTVSAPSAQTPSTITAAMITELTNLLVSQGGSATTIQSFVSGTRSDGLTLNSTVAQLFSVPDSPPVLASLLRQYSIPATDTIQAAFVGLYDATSK